MISNLSRFMGLLEIIFFNLFFANHCFSCCFPSLLFNLCSLLQIFLWSPTYEHITLYSTLVHASALPVTWKAFPHLSPSSRVLTILTQATNPEMREFHSPSYSPCILLKGQLMQYALDMTSERQRDTERQNGRMEMSRRNVEIWEMFPVLNRTTEKFHLSQIFFLCRYLKAIFLWENTVSP